MNDTNMKPSEITWLVSRRRNVYNPGLTFLNVPNVLRQWCVARCVKSYWRRVTYVIVIVIVVRVTNGNAACSNFIDINN